MVYLELRERAGNQFFQYAFARKLMIETNDKELIIDDFAIREKNKPEEGWVNSLPEFNVVPFVTATHNKYTPIQRALIHINWLFTRKTEEERLLQRQKILAPILNKFGIYFVQDGYINFQKPFPFVKKKIVAGYFESAKYFETIDDIIKMELSPKSSVRPENVRMLEKIAKGNSVCVSIRRGDFLSEGYKAARYICGPEYFRKAFDIIYKNVENPIFCFFSDDIEWVKENIKVKGTTLYETGNDSLGEKIRLMSSCKHFIISNSTFSWWAQHLSNNKDKIVIAPTRWRNDSKPVGLYEDGWTLVGP